MFGYKGFPDLLSSLFKAVDTSLVVKYLVPFFILIDSFFKWVFVSSAGIYFLMILYCIDFLTGIGKAAYFSLKIRKYKKDNIDIPKDWEEKKLVSKKFPRFLITMLCAVLLLALLQFAGLYSVVFIPLYSIFYAVFTGQQLISITENLNEVGLVSMNILSKLRQKITDITN